MTKSEIITDDSNWVGPRETFLNFQAIATTTKYSKEYSWLTYDLVVNMLEDYTGNQGLQCPQASSCQLQSGVQLANHFQYVRSLKLGNFWASCNLAATATVVYLWLAK